MFCHFLSHLRPSPKTSTRRHDHLLTPQCYSDYSHLHRINHLSLALATSARRVLYKLLPPFTLLRRGYRFYGSSFSVAFPTLFFRVGLLPFALFGSLSVRICFNNLSGFGMLRMFDVP